MTKEEIKQEEEHYKKMANAYIDKGIKSAGGVRLPERLRNDFVCMFVAGCFAATKELHSQSEIKLFEITNAEWNQLNLRQDTYFCNGCVFDEETDNLIAFSWYEDAMHEADKFYKVVK